MNLMDWLDPLSCRHAGCGGSAIGNHTEILSVIDDANPNALTDDLAFRIGVEVGHLTLWAHGLVCPAGRAAGVGF